MEPIVQSVHPGGRCSIDFVSDKKVVTCGSDGSVRLVSLFPLEDSGLLSYDESNFQFVCIAVHPKNKIQFALAKEDSGFDGKVEFFEIRGDDLAHLTGRITQVTMGICDLSWSSDGEWLIVGTDNEGVRAVKISDPSSCVTLKNSTGAIVGTAFDPKGEFLCSISSDGAVCIYSVNEWRHIKTKPRFCERDDNIGSSAVTPNKPAWSLDGSLLAIPGASTIRVIKRSDWDQEEEFENADFSSRCTHATFSASRLAVCCAGSESKLIIWDLESRKITHSFLLEQPFHALKFSNDSKKERLVGINNFGEIYLYEFESMLPLESSTPSHVTATRTELFDEENDQDNDVVSNHQVDDDVSPSGPLASVHRNFSSQEDEENDRSFENVESLVTMKKAFGIDEAGQRIPGARVNSSSEFETEDFIHLQKNTQAEVSKLEDEVLKLRDEVDHLKEGNRECFQPSSTEFDEEGRRFLCWNLVGTITCRKDRSNDIPFQSIEIEFADSAVGRPMRFRDDICFDKASLSESGVFLSYSPKDQSNNEEEDNVEQKESAVQFRAFNSPFSSSTWDFTLPKREFVTAISCAKEFSVAATNRGFLRIFRPSGLQEPVSVIPGPILCMTATGSLLLILYHRNSTRYSFETSKFEREIGFQFLNIGREGQTPEERLLCSGSLPCQAGIEWCGFADESLGFMPVIYRKDGVLIGLSVQSSWTWVVLADGSEREKGVKLWPVSVSKTGGLLAVALRGSKKIPSVQPRSTPSLYRIQIPILGLKKNIGNSNKSKTKFDFESESLFELLCLDQHRWAKCDSEQEIAKLEAKADLTLLTALLVAIKSNNPSRALGLASRMRLPKTVEIAVDKAQEYGAEQDLLDKLVELLSEKKQEMDELVQLEDREVEVEESWYENKRQRLTPAKVNSARSQELEEDEDVVEPTLVYDDEYISVNGSQRVQAIPTSPSLRSPPPNPFLKSSSPASREKKAAYQKHSPVRLPELGRQASFTVEVLDKHRRKL